MTFRAMRALRNEPSKLSLRRKRQGAIMDTSFRLNLRAYLHVQASRRKAVSFSED
ncbi:MAG: hypothetical protein JWO94_3859 [Verrucomicrobiaceae bacterium]|nr:hypothetical protein [Verrucomicrobiaceae bacterium]